MAKIMYWMGDNQSGVEQIGHIFAMLLTKLGHDVSVFMTQDVNTEKELGKKAKDFDVIVYNEGYPHVFNRMNPKCNAKEFNICHGIPPKTPLNIVHLCLNGPLAMHHQTTANLMVPIPYPFFNRTTLGFKENPKQICLYVGRFNEYKFPSVIRKQLKEKNVPITAVISGKEDVPVSDRDLFTTIHRNFPICKVHEMMQDSMILLVPSVSECLSLVTGEGLALGMQVLVVEQHMPHVYTQYLPYVHIAQGEPDKEGGFIDLLERIMNEKQSELYRRRIQQRAFMRSFFSIDRTMYALDLVFGHDHKKGSYEIWSHYDPSDVVKRIEFTNAQHITNMEDYTNVARSF